MHTYIVIIVTRGMTWPASCVAVSVRTGVYRSDTDGQIRGNIRYCTPDYYASPMPGTFLLGTYRYLARNTRNSIY